MVMLSNTMIRSILAASLLGSYCQGETSAPMTRTYDCNHPENAQCGKDADRFYEVIAVYDQYRVDNYPGGTNTPDADFAYMRLRSFIGGEGFEEDEKMLNNALGPNLKVKPGESMSVLLRNNLQKGTPPIPIGDGHHEDSVLIMKYFPQLNASNTEGAYYGMQAAGFEFYGETPVSIDDVEVPNPENIPYDYDGVNLHLHGAIINPHLFFPQGTSEVSAPFINVEPGECYCYNFFIPESHPSGTYWWHTHRHGSSAIWTWGQAAGLVEIEGTFEKELAEQGVEDSIPFVVTDPHLVYTRGELNTYVVTPFLGGQNGVKVQHDILYLVNGEAMPTFEMRPGETKWMKFLTATTENLCSFQITNKETGEVIGTWDLASDGVNYEKPIYTEEFLQGGGMRQDLLVQFPEAGIYEVRTEGNSHIQFFGHGPPDQLLATFVVTGEPVDTPVDIESMKFSLPLLHAQSISEEDITVRREVTFDVDGNVRIVPFPQMVINHKAFHIDEIMYDIVMDGHFEEWTLKSTANATHPFHIHVVPFLVKETTVDNIHPKYRLYEEAPSTHAWRDAVVVPPLGEVKIWLEFSPIPETNLNGKSVFHCHFLAHEDTGMIQQIMFIDPTFEVAQTADKASVCSIDELSTMCNILEICGANAFGARTGYTIFAPTNEAFEDVEKAVGGLENLDEDTLCDIFAFHFTEGIIHSEDMTCEAGKGTLIEMANGKTTRIKCTSGTPYGIKGGGNDEPANFVEVDLDQSNGVVHMIDKVLFYPSVVNGMAEVSPTIRGYVEDVP